MPIFSSSTKTSASASSTESFSIDDDETREVDELVAYVEAVSDFDPVPDAVAQGRDAAARLGCFACHGPQGRGDGQNAYNLQPPPPDFQESLPKLSAAAPLMSISKSSRWGPCGSSSGGWSGG